MDEPEVVARFQALEAELAALKISIGQAREQSASLAKWRNVAIGLAALALLTPALLFTGLLSPRFKTVRAHDVEATRIEASYVDLHDPSGAGHAWLGVTGDVASLSLVAPGSSISASVGQSAFLTVDAKEQTIQLSTFDDPLMGASVSTESAGVRAALTANRNGGDEASLTLQATTGTTSLSARRDAGIAAPFISGLSMQAQHSDDAVHLGLNSNGPRLSLEAADGRIRNSIALDAARDSIPMVSLVHSKENKGAPSGDNSSVGLIAAIGAPRMFGQVGSQDTWSIPASAK